MDPVTPPIGAFVKFFGWFADFLAMPGRVKMLADGLKASGDVRTRCTSCADGRVGDLEDVETSYLGSTRGTCDRCGKRWLLRANGAIIGLSTD